MKTCLKTLSKLNATDVIQNVTFLSAAVISPDKSKSRQKIAAVFNRVICGEIKNMWTKDDYILFLYHCCEKETAMGRDDAFPDQTLDGQRTNLLGDSTAAPKNQPESTVARPDENVFRLQNYDLAKVSGVGHTKIREILPLILKFIEFRH